MKRFDLPAIAWLLVWGTLALVSFFSGPRPDPIIGRRPLPTPPEVAARQSTPETPMAPQARRRPLPPPSDKDETFGFEINEARRNFTGTAFSVSSSGAWMTARHVTDGCNETQITTLRSQHTGTVAYAHSSADLAVVAARSSGSALPISDAEPVADQDGYSFGFPMAKLGGTHAQLLGRGRARLTGRVPGIMTTLLWAEVDRYPADLEELGGISGGPMFDEDGRVMGIQIAGWPRRGRMVTVAPETLREARAATRLMPPAAGTSPVTELTFPTHSLQMVSEALFRQGRLGWVRCIRLDAEAK